MTVQCITCQHFSFRRAGRMAVHAVGVCANKATYEFMSASFQRVCDKHAELDAEAVAKRRAWVEGLR